MPTVACRTPKKIPAKVVVGERYTPGLASDNSGRYEDDSERNEMSHRVDGEGDHGGEEGYLSGTESRSLSPAPSTPDSDINSDDFSVG